MVKQVSSFVCKHWQWLVGAIAGFVLGLVSISYGAGVRLTTIERDVRGNSEAISKMAETDARHEQRFEDMQVEQSELKMILTRVDESVTWIKDEMRRDGK